MGVAGVAGGVSPGLAAVKPEVGGLELKRSYTETFFRHRLLLAGPVIIAFVLAAGYGLHQPRSYVATAAIWTDRRIPADSTIGTNPGSDVPSAGQQALLAGLLASRTFMLTVARDSPLADETHGPQLQVDLALARLAASVSVSTPGPQVMTIAVKQRSPDIATGVAHALVRQFMAMEADRIRTRAKAQVTYDKQQMDAASKSLHAAENALLAYTRDHPGAAQNQADTAETSLVGALALAQQHYSEASKSYTESSAALSQAIAGALDVLDPPTQAFPQSRRKVVLFSAVGGLLAGLSISIATLLLLTTRDRAVREEADLEQALGLRVVGSIGELSKLRSPLRSVLFGNRTESASPRTSS